MWGGSFGYYSFQWWFLLQFIMNFPEPNTFHGKSFRSILFTRRKKREPTIFYYTRERRRFEPRRCRYKRTTRLNIMLDRWSTNGGGEGTRTVSHRQSPPIGARRRPQSAAREHHTSLKPPSMPKRQKGRWKSIFGDGYSH